MGWNLMKQLTKEAECLISAVELGRRSDAEKAM